MARPTFDVPPGDSFYAGGDGAAAGFRRLGPERVVPPRGMTRDGRFAPSPTGTLHLGNLRTALLAWLFARSAGARFLVRMEDLDYGRVQPDAAARQLEDLAALGLDWDGEVVFQSSRHDAYERRDRARCDRAGRIYECFCTRAEIRAAASAPHEPLPEGAYPGTCLHLTERREAQQARGRAPAGPARAGGRRARGLHRPAPRRAARASWTTSSCGATTARRPTTSPWWSTTRGRPSARSCGATTCSTPRRASSSSPTCSACPRPTHAHVPLVLGPDGARLAKRHGAVTLDDVAPRAALGWMAATLGLPPAERAADLLEGFEPARLPRDPVRLASL